MEGTEGLRYQGQGLLGDKGWGADPNCGGGVIVGVAGGYGPSNNPGLVQYTWVVMGKIGEGRVVQMCWRIRGGMGNWEGYWVRRRVGGGFTCRSEEDRTRGNQRMTEGGVVGGGKGGVVWTGVGGDVGAKRGRRRQRRRRRIEERILDVYILLKRESRWNRKGHYFVLGPGKGPGGVRRSEKMWTSGIENKLISVMPGTLLLESRLTGMRSLDLESISW
eukprot:760923-Hanusia_phi.AAC.4